MRFDSLLNMKKQKSPLKIIILVWIIFSIPYVIYTQYNYFKRFVADAAYEKGLTDAVSQLIQQGQKCEPIPIRLRDQNISMINVACLTQGQANANAAQPTE